MAALKFPQRCQSKRGKKEALAERMRRVSEAARGRPWRPGALGGARRWALISPRGAGRRSAPRSAPAHHVSPGLNDDSERPCRGSSTPAVQSSSSLTQPVAVRCAAGWPRWVLTGQV